MRQEVLLHTIEYSATINAFDKDRHEGWCCTPERERELDGTKHRYSAAIGACGNRSCKIVCTYFLEDQVGWRAFA